MPANGFIQKKENDHFQINDHSLSSTYFQFTLFIFL